MGKYIIDVDDKYVSPDSELIVSHKNLFDGDSCSYHIQIAKLTPYTEPDLDAIKQEEYEKGYKTAKVQCNIQAEKDLREVGERHYQKGLSDAWEAARKIALDKEDGGLDTVTYCEIFGYGKGFGAVLKTYTASEAIEKIRQYEQEKDKQARIEYNCEEIKDVLNTTMKECNVSLDDIAEVLQKMREKT